MSLRLSPAILLAPLRDEAKAVSTKIADQKCLHEMRCPYQGFSSPALAQRRRLLAANLVQQNSRRDRRIQRRHFALHRNADALVAKRQ
ncbi:hypothetical protein Pla52o_49740 [Novipirellula galeiformis]|uniref:Uncharacterized protein n=1 Tax=Novipirellula galeiformis TaxID=2528004 RepID=A0A5C6C4M9_9BACT|nr:hypothetical protein Pla52o_49740 [Novipirellula galeiformis]